MQEEFLHFIWQNQRFDKTDLKSVNREPIEIIHQGFLNHNGGPDFSNARIKIGETQWAGNLEIHVNSSDWYVHKHQHNRAYDNVVLHVVFNFDKATVQDTGVEIPVLELKGRVSHYLLEQYKSISENINTIPCSFIWKTPPNAIRYSWLQRMAVERFQQKSAEVQVFYNQSKGDWEHTFFFALAKAFGARSNQLPFIQLAQHIPLNLVKKVAKKEEDLEVLIFGMTGLLEIEEQDYFVLKLLDGFQFFKQKYQLNPLKRSVWNYGRIRPFSFPDIRIAQWVAFLSNNLHNLFGFVLDSNLSDLKEGFRQKLPTYWSTHYRFSVETKKHESTVSKNFCEKLIVNGIVPLRLLYASETGDEQRLESALDILNELKPEQNKVVSRWKELPLPIENALQSQAVLHLEKEYCFKKQCLKCNFGNYLLHETS